MSRKNVNNFVAFNDVVDGYGVESEVSSIAFLDNVSYQVEWTGDLEGTFAVLASNNYDKVKNLGTFYELTFSPGLGAATGTPGGYLINLNQLPFKDVKMSFTPSAGSGTLTIIINSKMI